MGNSYEMCVKNAKYYFFGDPGIGHFVIIITQPTNALIVCNLFLNHFFKTLSLLLHVSIAYCLCREHACVFPARETTYTNAGNAATTILIRKCSYFNM